MPTNPKANPNCMHIPQVKYISNMIAVLKGVIMDYMDEIKNKYKPGEVILLKDLFDGKSEKECARIRAYLAKKSKNREDKTCHEGSLLSSIPDHLRGRNIMGL